MRRFATPNVVVSRCIEFDRCRYNGDVIASPIVRQLKEYVRFLPVCPEVAIGLGVPREPIRLVAPEGNVRLVQPATGRDLTERMETFTDTFLDSLREIDGFILKSRSPSCGTRDVHVYAGTGRSAVVDRKSGLFAREVQRRFAHLAVEDEGRLRNHRIREHFLTKLFTLAEFRGVSEAASPERLAAFHTEHTLLLQAYNRHEAAEMARIAGDRSIPPDTASEAYARHLSHALSRPPDAEAYIRVMTGVVQALADRLSPQERGLFRDAIGKYQDGFTSRCPAINILKTWVVRFDDPFYQQQSIFAPYPDALLDVEEVRSDRGRDLWQETG
ncbi:DUF1722 domain-containing protein [Methanoculleus sp. FWC-SCC1]|uniref:DUF1722 domain-containing protein n=1 Tax=Methanoculleus frigidifontis TaxID=2584085 RepID=A0ABT8ME22_9EURY|nr:DUF523 and DUF1722 domain-containing protein [Methanoculleus sp. FWC-SCC1]MDN7026187.1 DUF1722 domain-containing protein [Methanoculleus sp. FWC-SCC1]